MDSVSNFVFSPPCLFFHGPCSTLQSVFPDQGLEKQPPPLPHTTAIYRRWGEKEGEKLKECIRNVELEREIQSRMLFLPNIGGQINSRMDY